jgi:hypothetical protein
MEQDFHSPVIALNSRNKQLFGNYLFGLMRPALRGSESVATKEIFGIFPRGAT